MGAFAFFLPLLGIFLLFAFWHMLNNHDKSNNMKFNTASSIQGLLNPLHQNRKEQLRRRSQPNARLLRAFELTNTFVSDDADLHKKFVSHARRLVGDAPAWAGFSEICRRAAQASLRGEVTPFHVYVQSVTLRVVLAGFLDVGADVETFREEDISIVAHHITMLWALSKRPHPIPSHLLPELNSHLRFLLPDNERYPNPLDFVIPAWETLWRVVAITLAYAHSDVQSLRVMEGLLDCPTNRQFESEDKTASCLSAQSLILEAMRLHPPSKHISRLQDCKFSAYIPPALRQILEYIWPGSTTWKSFADVEAVQRSSLWGADANEFDPNRHHISRLTSSQADTLPFVFGYKPLRCVAEKWAPMAAAIICAAILDGLKEGSGISAGSSIGGREGWEGWTVSSSRA